MKTKPVILGFVLFYISFSLSAQTLNTHPNSPTRQLASSPTHQLANSPVRQLTNYDRQWKKVDSLSNLGLPKSALEIVNKIYEQAKKEKNDPQYIKAVIFRLKLKADYREESATASIMELRTEIKESREPARQILNSILAEIYQRYYQNNRYRFQDRTQVLNNTSDSIRTWDLKTLTRKTLKTYLLSLWNPALLQLLPIGNFENILINQESQGRKAAKMTEKGKTGYRPTLYDFLCWRAMDYFSGNENLDKVSSEPFSIEQVSYFRQAQEFAVMKLELPVDSSSFLAYELKIYHDLAAFHANDKDPRALIDEEIHRFQFLKENSIIDGKDSLYLDALKKLEQTHLASPFSTNVTYAIASFLKEQGSQYRPESPQKHKWDLKEALEYCNLAIKRFPQSTGANNSKLLAGEIEKPALQVQTEYAVVPQKPSLTLIEFRNVKTLYFRLSKTDPEVNQEKTMNRSRENLVSYYTSLAFQKNWSQEMPNDGDYQSHRIEIRVPELAVGFYILIASSDPDFKDASQVITWAPFFSTQISYISQRNEKSEITFYILDRETGLPLKNVVVGVFHNVYNYNARKYENQKLGEYVTDENGTISLPALPQNLAYNNLFLRLKMNDDIFVTVNYYQYPVNESAEKTTLKTFFFTDRGIYRSGQTVYFKGILLEKKGDNLSIKQGLQTTTIFTDVNSQKIADQTFTSNEFGSFNGSFVIPQGLLPGSMTISNGSGSATISVEEYKRPTFGVSFDSVEGNYRLNDSVTIRGKAVAYAGNNIDGAAVKYRVVRSARFPFQERGWWYPLPSIPETEIMQGVLKTDSDGSFKVRFKAIPDRSIDKSSKPVFDYVIFADVTDINGETQSANESVSVGYISLLVGMDIPEKLDPVRDTLFHLSATNLNGRKTPTIVTVNIQRLHQPDRFFVLRQWAKPEFMGITEKEFHSTFPNNVYADENLVANWPVEQDILKKEINTATDSLFRFSQIASWSADKQWRLADGKILPQGTYLLTLKAKDPYGEDVEQKSTFVIYDPSSAMVPVPEIDWFVPVKTSGEPGEKAKFLIGSKAENVNVLYEIRVHDTLFSRRWMKVSNSQVLVEIPILEKFRGNFSVNFVFIRYNRSFQHSERVNVPYTNKKLDIKFETFRNKLYPGQIEEWKIRITDAAKKGVKAEYLTAMYDASLDVFAPNSWSFSILRDYYSSLPWEVNGGSHTSSGLYYPLHYSPGEYFFPAYEELDWFGFGLVGGGRYRGYGSGRMQMDKSAEFIAPMVVADAISKDETYPPPPPPASLDGKSGEANKVTQKAEKQATVQIRRDFRETAFFYPSLVTDSAGNLDIKFTLPESLTKWKILGFAYTKQLDYGLTEKEILTHKDLMVFPNSPRFVRQGDTLVFSAKVVNLSERALNGEVMLELSDALTQKTVSLVISGNQTQAFTLPTGQSSAFQWSLAIPHDPSLSVLQYRITAKAGNFSDGEEKAFPVLTNRMLVTEALPLPVRGKGSFDFKFDKLFNSSSGKTLKNYKLTLEFASNPAWYAVQALSTLDEPTYPNADNVFRSFYANSIASFIANSNPKIKKVFESWKNLTPDALLSNLEKNQPLKSALLQETPWVLEAKDESQRKQRLAMLFDLNTLSGRLDQNLKKLQKMQVSSGGWPWFDGMPENRYITQEIVTGLGHMDHLGITNIRDDKDTWNMLNRAIGYLDNELVKDYNDIKEYYPDKMDLDHLGTIQIQYLYARSYYLSDIPLKGNNDRKTAFRYFQQQAERYWLQNDLYCQGMIGLALNRLGNMTVPAAILKSLSEKALHSPEMGMYWATQGGYEWYQAPVETQALLIEAYEEITADQKPVDEMKIWLLKQKQTQDWKTGCATAEACYALLLRGTDLLAEDPGVKINLGNEVIDPQKLTDTKVEAGTGYFQVNRDGKEIRPEMGNVTISKSNEGVAWGALYWQYFEDLDKITAHATPLKLEKKLFIERVTPTGNVLQPIMKDRGLKIGDKIIVRIILSVDRNLEFVHMKDMRASAFEPLTSEQMSGYRYQDGLGYYQSTSDMSTNFFFETLPKGTWVFEYPLVVNAAGEYSNGITTVQCMYAPEFGAHSEGIRVKVGR
jgi:5-hydroxyisourate hydrolase-like protein (transthyretin family)